MQVQKNLIIINLPANNPDKARQFYEKFFGVEFAPSLSDENDSYHAPISRDGIDFIINQRHNPQEQTTAYYAVDNLDAAVKEATAGGARVVWGPGDLPIAPGEKEEYKRLVQEVYPEDGPPNDDLGRAVLLLDPEGNSVGLVELEKHAHGHFKHGKHRLQLDDKQERAFEKSKELGKKHKERKKGGGKPK